MLIIRNSNKLTTSDIKAVLACNPNTIIEMGTPENSSEAKKKRLVEQAKREKTIDKCLSFIEISVKKIMNGKI